MATFEITLSDGSAYEVDAPDEATAKQRLMQSLTPQQTQQPNTLADVAKSAGSGLVTGAEKLLGLPGDIQHQFDRLGRFIGDKIYGEATPEQAAQLDRMKGLRQPTSEQVAGLNNQVTGFTPHQPQTTAGEFANTAAEFVPGAMAFGGANTLRGLGGAAVKYGVVPGLTSEGAGQAARKFAPSMEAPARIAGAFAGPALVAGARRALTPTRSDSASQAAAQTLRNEGVDVTAGQATGNTRLKYAEAELGGRRAADFMERQAEQFTAAALKRIGVRAKRATPEVMDDAFTRIGQEFDDLASRHTLRLDQAAKDRLVDAYVEYKDLVAPNNIVPKVQKSMEDLFNPAFVRGDVLSGGQYKEMRTALDRAARTLSRRGDPAADALWDMRNALDDAMERSITNPSDKGAWRLVRQKYRNILPIEQAMAGSSEATMTGLITPDRLRAAVVRQNKRAFVRGKGDLASLARAGSAVLKPLPQSGTAPRLMAQGAGQTAGALIGNALVPGPVGILGGMALGATAPRLIGAGMLSRGGQAYLGNQLMQPPVGSFARALPPVAANAALEFRR